MIDIRNVWKPLVASLPLLTFACGDDAPPESSLSYAHDIAPIFDRYCVSCHGSSAFAPFTFLSYEDAYEHGREAVVVIKSHKMPPCAQEDESCAPTKSELSTLEQWVEQGRPEGPP
jgi:hypothetical protein